MSPSGDKMLSSFLRTCVRSPELYRALLYAPFQVLVQGKDLGLGTLALGDVARDGRSTR